MQPSFWDPPLCATQNLYLGDKVKRNPKVFLFDSFVKYF